MQNPPPSLDPLPSIQNIILIKVIFNPTNPTITTSHFATPIVKATGTEELPLESEEEEVDQDQASPAGAANPVNPPSSADDDQSHLFRY